MRKVFAVISAAVLLQSAVSCSNTDIEPSGAKGDGSIRIGAVSVASAITKSHSSQRENACEYSDESSGILLSVTESDSLIPEGPRTKAEVTTETLGSFQLEGYLDTNIKDKIESPQSDKDNLHFMSTSASKSGSKWTTASPYYWRYNVDHHFWAYAGSLTGFSANQSADFANASFNYVSDGTEDLLVAYHKQHWDADENGHTTDDDELNKLTFEHALSVVSFTQNITFKEVPVTNGVATGTPTVLTNGRCSIDGIELRHRSSGSCTAYSDGRFAWTPGTAMAVENIPTSGLFVIPQAKTDENLRVVYHITDSWRTLTLPFVFNGTELFGSGSGSWESGHKYDYNITGSFTVPYLPENPHGINADFAGKDFHTLAVISGISTQYIKKMRLTWTGLPSANDATGTYAFISIEPSGSVPQASNYVNNDGPVLENNHIGYIFKHKSPSATLKGHSNDPSTGECWCEIDLTGISGSINIYASFNGGSNQGGGAGCTWNMSNFKCEIIEFR